MMPAMPLSIVQKAKKELGVSGFVAIKEGTPLYKKAKAFFNQ